MWLPTPGTEVPGYSQGVPTGRTAVTLPRERELRMMSHCR